MNVSNCVSYKKTDWCESKLPVTGRWKNVKLLNNRSNKSIPTLLIGLQIKQNLNTYFVVLKFLQIFHGVDQRVFSSRRLSDVDELKPRPYDLNLLVSIIWKINYFEF